MLRDHLMDVTGGGAEGEQSGADDGGEAEVEAAEGGEEADGGEAEARGRDFELERAVGPADVCYLVNYVGG